MDEKAILLQALMAIDRGERTSARALLAQTLAADPRNDVAWVAMARAVDDAAQQRDCLTRALAANPDNPEARHRLDRLLSPPLEEADGEAAQAEPVPSLVLLSCPTCGNKLEMTANVDRFACAACGNEFVIRRSGGTVSVAPLVAEIKDVHQTVDRTAAELAMIRLQQELASLDARRGKARDDFARQFRSFGLVPVIAVVLILAPGPVRSLFSISGVPVGGILLLAWVVAFVWLFGRSQQQTQIIARRVAEIKLDLARQRAVVGDEPRLGV
jgi:hypothetical protein